MSNTIQPGYGMNALAGLYNLAGVSTRNSGISFMDLASVTAAGAAATQNVAGMSFEEMCQARFPGAYYHVMDASKTRNLYGKETTFPLRSFLLTR